MLGKDTEVLQSANHYKKNIFFLLYELFCFVESPMEIRPLTPETVSNAAKLLQSLRKKEVADLGPRFHQSWEWLKRPGRHRLLTWLPLTHAQLISVVWLDYLSGWILAWTGCLGFSHLNAIMNPTISAGTCVREDPSVCQAVTSKTHCIQPAS